PETTVDVEALYAALDAKRQTVGQSWRELATELVISPSTFTRMAQGKRPDVDTFATLLRWLGMPAELFMRPHLAMENPPEPVAMFSTYLRADRHLSDEDAKTIEAIAQAAYKRFTRPKE